MGLNNFTSRKGKHYRHALLQKMLNMFCVDVQEFWEEDLKVKTNDGEQDARADDPSVVVEKDICKVQ